MTESKSPVPRKTPAVKKAVAKKAAVKLKSQKALPESLPDDEKAPEKHKSASRGFGSFNFKGIRDTLLFVAGLAGVFYETVFTKADRPTLLLLFAAMMGLPAFLRTDEHRRD